jgi:hypothetical protein
MPKMLRNLAHADMHACGFLLITLGKYATSSASPADSTAIFSLEEEV